MALGPAAVRHPDSRVLASLPLLVLPPEPAAELRGLFGQMLEEAAWQPGRGGGASSAADLAAARAFLAGSHLQQGRALGAGAAALLAQASSLGLAPLAQDVQLVMGADAPAPPVLLDAAGALLGFLAERGCRQLVLLLLGRLEAAGVQLELAGAPVTSAAMSASGALLGSAGSSPGVTGPAGGAWPASPPGVGSLNLLASSPSGVQPAAAAALLPVVGARAGPQLVVPEPAWHQEDDLPLSAAQLSSALLQPALFLSADHSLATLAAIGAAGPAAPAESGTTATDNVLGAGRRAQQQQQLLLDSPFDLLEAEQLVAAAAAAAGGSELQGSRSVGERQRKLQAALAAAASASAGSKGGLPPGGGGSRSGSAWCDSAAAHHHRPAAARGAADGGGRAGALLHGLGGGGGGGGEWPLAEDADAALVSDANNVVPDSEVSGVAALTGAGCGGGLLLAGLAALVLAVVLAWLLG